MATALRHLLDWQFLPDEVWNRLVDRACEHYKTRDRWGRSAAGKSLGMLFFNPSLRTRTSMELAAAQLGAHPTTLNVGEGVWGFEWQDGVIMTGGAAEHIREAVGVLSRYYDALGVRLFASGTDYEADRTEALLHTFAAAATVPVVSLEGAFYHPCQALGDAATLHTHFNGDVRGKKFVLSWAYHPKPLPMAVPNSALLMAARCGMEVTVARPESHALDPQVMALARTYAEANGTTVVESTDQDAAFRDADVIYAKAWGGPMVYTDPTRENAIRNSLIDWRVTQQRMDLTHNGVFMHCLPVRRNVVVDDAVLDGPNTIHLLEAEFRLHAQKAMLEYMWEL